MGDSFMNLNPVGVAVTMLCLIAACTKLEEKSAQTVDYYRAHPQERQALVKSCTNDPARASRDAECINALAAEERESIGSQDKLPPMGLVPEGKKPGGVR
jgi:hypothetical protein